MDLEFLIFRSVTRNPDILKGKGGGGIILFDCVSHLIKQNQRYFSQYADDSWLILNGSTNSLFVAFDT